MCHQVINQSSAPKPRSLNQLMKASHGFAAAEAVLLAVVLIGIALMVGSVLVPAARTAAKRLHSELAGGTKASR